MNIKLCIKEEIYFSLYAKLFIMRRRQFTEKMDQLTVSMKLLAREYLGLPYLMQIKIRIDGTFKIIYKQSQGNPDIEFDTSGTFPSIETHAKDIGDKIISYDSKNGDDIYYEEIARDGVSYSSIGHPLQTDYSDNRVTNRETIAVYNPLDSRQDNREVNQSSLTDLNSLLDKLLRVAENENLPKPYPIRLTGWDDGTYKIRMRHYFDDRRNVPIEITDNSIALRSMEEIQRGEYIRDSTLGVGIQYSWEDDVIYYTYGIHNRHGAPQGYNVVDTFERPAETIEAFKSRDTVIEPTD